MARRFDVSFLNSDDEPEVVILSSDSEMETGGWTTDEDYYEEPEIQQMAFCVERALENAGTTGGRVLSVQIPTSQNQPGPSTSAMDDLGRFPPLYYEAEMGHGPIMRGHSQKTNHPIQFCKELPPVMDSPWSPPPEDKYPPASNYATDGSSDVSNPMLEDMIKHFKDLEVKQSGQPMFSDCLVCGKKTEQIQDEAVIDYLHKTPIPGESAEQFNARRLAFLAGMKAGTFLLVTSGVSQAAACDGNYYTVQPNGDSQKALPRTLPLNNQ